MKFSIVIALMFLLPMSVFGGVNLKNGNFYISYTDIIVPGGGQDLEVIRTYNSKSIEKGWFGYGWGSDYETYLTVSADGSVVIHENGSGALTRFTPRAAVDAKAATQKIIDAMRKRTALNDKVASDLTKKLVNNAELRQAYAKKFSVAAKISNGTELYSNARGLQKVKKTKAGYVRFYNDGKSEHFNNVGKLTKIKDKNGYFLSFQYKSGTLASIKDSQAKQLFFEWYPDGKVKHISSGKNKKTAYKYKGDDLSESKDVAGNVFKYDFDADHNLAAVNYSDKSKMQVVYTPKTQFVKKIVSRNGDVTGYKYDSNPKNPDFHYWTEVTKKGPSGKSVTNRYEYEIKTRPDGSQYTYRILTVINNSKTETIYSECCSLPLKITRGKHVTTFDYNKRGLLTKKSSTRGELIQLSYHKTLNKITKVQNKKGWTQFKYDKKGNLAKATNNKGMSVLLVYDRKGRIERMIDHNRKTNKKRKLSFKYNALGKPVEIEMKSVGKINVAYDNYGEIKKVESKAGHKMALQVTQAFQSLLSIVKPAGVNLNM